MPFEEPSAGDLIGAVAIRAWPAVALAFVLLLVGLLPQARASALSLDEIGKFANPTYVTSDPHDANRLFVVERDGRIQVIDNGQTSLFLDIAPIVLSQPEAGALDDDGLWSMAFSPDYARNHLFYVAYRGVDDPDTAGVDEWGEWHIDEFRADGDTADPASRREVLTIPYPAGVYHHGGQLQFGPDGYLYASTGDGGPQGDPDGNAQNLDSLYGKIIRIDPRRSVSGDYSVPADNPFAGATPGRDEIWSYGLRNPWRFSFDRLTGDLVIGDVGYNSWEEVDFETGPDPGKGDNFGWNCREGAHPGPGESSPVCSDRAGTFTDPVFDYPHVGACSSITGGYVVRDTSLGDLYGRYLYADFCADELRSLNLSLPAPGGDRSEGLSVPTVSSFGEDSSCRIYVVSLAGPVYRLTEGGSAGGCPKAAAPPSEPPLPSPRPSSQAGALCRGERATIVGSSGPDSLRGTAKRDVIVGRGGRDTIRGLGGNDIICGERGRDTLMGGPGNDTLLGGADRDRLLGGPGSDLCNGGPALDKAGSCTISRRL